jgi:hydrogenase nickel incorporation protein HypA/HybF
MLLPLPRSFVVHEFAICGLLIKALDAEYDALDPAPLGLVSVTVVVGELHQIVDDYLVGAFQALTADTRFAGAQLKLSSIPVTGTCRPCSWEGTIQPPLFVCPECHAAGVELVTGKELYIETLEIKT